MTSKVFHVSCSNLFYMFLITNSRESSIKTERIEMVDSWQFNHILCLQFCLVGAITSKSFSCTLLKFVMHIANNKYLDEFNNGGGLLLSLLFLIMSICNFMQGDAQKISFFKQFSG